MMELKGDIFMKKLILAVVGLFLSCTSAKLSENEVQTAPSVDLNKYIGKWYEVASIPQSFQKQCVGNTIADYSFGEKNLIVVINSCDTKTGKRSVSEGRAKIVDTNTNSKLKVTFVKLIDWIFAFGGNYWILDVDPGYNYALIGDPSRQYAWILSRTPNLPEEILVQAEKHFKAQGYDTCQILSSVQTGGFVDRKPICEIVKNLSN